MIYLTKGQKLLDNQSMVVYDSTGYYNDGDSVICASIGAPDEPVCRYEAKFIAYGGLVYSVSDEDELLEQILKLDPKSLFGKDSKQIAVDKAVEQIVPQESGVVPVEPVPEEVEVPEDVIDTETSTTTPQVTPDQNNSTSTTTPTTSTTTPQTSSNNNTATTTPDFTLPDLGGTSTTTPPIVFPSIDNSTTTPPTTSTTTPDVTPSQPPETSNNTSTTTPDVVPQPDIPPVPTETPTDASTTTSEVVAFAKKFVKRRISKGLGL